VERVSWRLEINHVTRYRYDRPVVSSYNEARVTPLTTANQIVIDARVRVSPTADTHTYWDYWGAYVHAFDVHDPHEALVVTSTALVETGTAPALSSTSTTGHPPGVGGRGR
jgi:transglutaminase-like putative cysteine protease